MSLSNLTSEIVSYIFELVSTEDVKVFLQEKYTHKLAFNRIFETLTIGSMVGQMDYSSYMSNNGNGKLYSTREAVTFMIVNPSFQVKKVIFYADYETDFMLFIDQLKLVSDISKMEFSLCINTYRFYTCDRLMHILDMAKVTTLFINPVGPIFNLGFSSDEYSEEDFDEDDEEEMNQLLEAVEPENIVLNPNLKELRLLHHTHHVVGTNYKSLNIHLLKNLRLLHIENNGARIEDFHFLEGLSHLKDLLIVENYLPPRLDMSRLVSLKTVMFMANNLKKFEFIFPPNLRELDMSYSDSLDLSKSTLPQTLEKLVLVKCGMKTFSTKNLPPNLIELNLKYNSIKGGIDFSRINLQILSLSFNPISLSDCKFADGLLTLNADDNKVDLKSLRLPDSVEEISFGGTHLTDFASFKFPKNITGLKLRCGIKTMNKQTIRFPETLKFLDLATCEFERLQEIDPLLKLEILILCHNNITTIDPNFKFPNNLNYINIGGNPDLDLSRVRFPAKLKKLEVSGTRTTIRSRLLLVDPSIVSFTNLTPRQFL